MRSDWREIFWSRTPRGSLIPTKQIEFSNIKLDDKIKYEDLGKKLNVEHTVRWSSLQLASMTPCVQECCFPRGPWSESIWRFSSTMLRLPQCQRALNNIECLLGTDEDTHRRVWSWRTQSVDEKRSWAHLSNGQWCKCLIWTVQFYIWGNKRRASFSLPSPMISNFDVAVGFACVKESWVLYRGTVANGRVSHSGEAKSDKPDENKYPGPPGWGLTTSPRKTFMWRKPGRCIGWDLEKMETPFEGGQGPQAAAVSCMDRWKERLNITTFL
jgi:hypothetical protein